MFSSKDFEKLWFLYQTEGVPEEESINSFCEKNGVPYDEFDKWFRKTHQAVGRVEIENIPDDEPIMVGGFSSRTVNNGNMIGADARTFKKCDYYSLLTNWFEGEELLIGWIIRKWNI